MTRRRICILALLVGLILFTGSVFNFLAVSKKFKLVREQRLAVSFEEAVERLPQKFLKTGRWTVRTVPCGLPEQSKGNRICVFELCARKYAAEILSDPVSRRNAAILPCKIAIYERDGQVWMSRLNPLLLKRVPGENAGIVFKTKILPEQDRLLRSLLRNDVP